ncbi:hypothetical protein DRO42_00600 [Candidatus Bathyarchaeota archaeon]|nr:MAG: hypothetical protein DRO42_00600 [Candidatus Bathyarchaeota archaeon]
MYRMFERTDLCPYTDRCESFQIICRAESWMERELARLRRENAQDFGDGGYSVQALQWRLEHMRRVRERCYSYNGRCLRFWQFKAREEGEIRPRRRESAWSRPVFEKPLVEPVLERSQTIKVEG